VRVTRWDFVPGADTGWHRHELDYVVTPVTDCAFLLEEPGGMSRRADMKAGAAYRRAAGVEHKVLYGGAAAISFVELELKI
jgi:hypothetical protein